MDDSKLTQDDINRMMQEQIAKRAGKAANKTADDADTANEKNSDLPNQTAVNSPAMPENPVENTADIFSKLAEQFPDIPEGMPESTPAVFNKPAETAPAVPVKLVERSDESSRNHFSSLEIDTLGEVGNISMGAAATALYSILGRKVVITTPNVSITNYQKLIENHRAPYFVVNVEYTEGFLGNNLFILQLDDVRIITDIMMGGDGTNTGAEMDEIHISAISEAMNQMMGAMSTSMATLFSRVINISPPKSAVVQLAEYGLDEIITADTNELVRISFTLQIEGLIDSSIMQLLPLDFAKAIVNELLNPTPIQPPVRMTEKAAKPAAEPAYQEPYAAPAPVEQKTASRSSSYDTRSEIPVKQEDNSRNRPVIDARPIQLTSFDAPPPVQDGNVNELGIDIILDVPLQVKVSSDNAKRQSRKCWTSISDRCLHWINWQANRWTWLQTAKRLQKARLSSSKTITAYGSPRYCLLQTVCGRHKGASIERVFHRYFLYCRYDRGFHPDLLLDKNPLQTLFRNDANEKPPVAGQDPPRKGQTGSDYASRGGLLSCGNLEPVHLVQRTAQ